MIDRIYINEAIRIREQYLDNLIYITNEEENIKALVSDLETIKEKVLNSDLKSETYYKDSLYEIEIMLKKASDKIAPFHDKIKELDKLQKTLYNTIKEKYPNIVDEQIQSAILPHIMEVDKKYQKKYGNLLK